MKRERPSTIGLAILVLLFGIIVMVGAPLPSVSAEAVPTGTPSPGASSTPMPSNTPTQGLGSTATSTSAPVPTSTATPTQAPTVTSAATATTIPGHATLGFNPPSKSNVQVGDSFTMDVTINATGGFVRGYQFGLTYDPSVVTVTGVTQASWLSDWATANGGTAILAQPWSTATPGTVGTGAVAVMGGTGSGATGSGTLATVSFQAVGNGSTNLHITNQVITQLSGGVGVAFPYVTLNDGAITVVAPTGTPTVTPVPPTGTPLPTFTATPTLVPEATLTVSNPPTNPGVNDTFTLNVVVNTTYKVLGTGFTLTFNPAVVHVSKVEAGDLLTTWAKNNGAITIVTPPFTPNNTTGVVSKGAIAIMGGPGNDGPVGSGNIAKITLTAVGQGTSQLTLGDAELWVVSPDNPNVSVQVGTTLVGGQVTVDHVTSLATNTPTPTGTPSATRTPTPTSSPTASLTPTPTMTLTPTLYVPTPGTPTPTGPTMTPMPSATPVPANASMSISPATTTVAAGASFDLSVAVTSDKHVRGFQFGLTFDASKVSVIGVDEGTFLKNWADANGAQTMQVGSWDVDNTAGTVSTGSISIMGSDSGGPTDSGTLAVIHLKGLADGTTTIALKDSMLTIWVVTTVNGTQLGVGQSVSNLQVQDGQVVVGNVTSTPTVGPGTPTVTPIAGTVTPGATIVAAIGTAAANGIGVPGGQSAIPGNSIRTSGGAQAPGQPGGGGAGANAGAAGAGNTSGAGGGVASGGGFPSSAGGPGAGAGSLAQAGPGGTGNVPGLGALPSAGQGGNPLNPSGAVGAAPGMPGGTAAPQSVLVDLSASINDRGVVQRDVRYASPDGRTALLISAGTLALTRDRRPLTSIQIQYQNIHPVVPDDVDVIGTAVEFGPTGSTFDPPIGISLRYDSAALSSDLTSGDLELAYFDVEAGKWDSMDCQVDSVNRTVTSKASHFTTFAILTKTPGGGVSLGWMGSILMAEAALAAGAYFLLVRRRRMQGAIERGWPEDFGLAEDVGHSEHSDFAGPSTQILLPPAAQSEETLEGDIVTEDTEGGLPQGQPDTLWVRQQRRGPEGRD